MKITAENYYTNECNKEYMSVSLYKELAGTLGKEACEARTIAGLNGEWEDQNKKAFIVGGYVDAYFEGTLVDYCKEHAEDIFTATSLKKLEKSPDAELVKLSDFKQADTMIERCLKDETFMKYMSGDKQVIMTGDFAGCEWKIKIDSYVEGKAIVDLKTCADIHKVFYVPDYGHCNFIEYYGYYTQLAVYQKIVEINTGKKLPCYIAAVSKSDFPEIKIIQLEQSRLDEALEDIKANIPLLIPVWKEEVEPVRCEKCDYCHSTEVLKNAIWASELIGEVAR